MTPRLLGPAFVQHSATYEKIVLDFVDLVWYFNPLISAKSLLFLSNRLAGIFGYYMTEEERRFDLADLEMHRKYMRPAVFYRQLDNSSLYSPKCFTYVHSIPWNDKLVIAAVINLQKRYLTSKFVRWLLNCLIWFGLFCIRQLSFMVVNLGFKNTYVAEAMRRAVLKKLCGDGSEVTKEELNEGERFL